LHRKIKHTDLNWWGKMSSIYHPCIGQEGGTRKEKDEKKKQKKNRTDRATQKTNTWEE